MFLAVTIFWLAIDLLTKGWAVSGAFVPVVAHHKWLYLSLRTNPGIAFGIPIPAWIQLTGSVAIIALLLNWFYRSEWKKDKWNQILFGAIIGGALGNLINRLTLGHVVDFIVLYPFPAFNLADIGITVGLGLFVLYNFSKLK